jgi:hypothetical protein
MLRQPPHVLFAFETDDQARRRVHVVTGLTRDKFRRDRAGEDVIEAVSPAGCRKSGTISNRSD